MAFLQEETARRRMRTYLHDLEEERKKIQVFQRELPLCFDLVSRTIQGYRQQLIPGTAVDSMPRGRRDWDNDTSSDSPVFEEFIPIKRSPEDDHAEDHNRHRRRNRDDDDEEDEKPAKKPDWMRSAQLWTPTHNHQPASSVQQDLQLRVKPIIGDPNRPNGAFLPFQRENRDAATTPPSVHAVPPSLPRQPQQACTASSTGDTAGSSKGTGPAAGTPAAAGESDDKEGQSSHRKVRRCWSPDLHGRFLDALHQLGGAHVATPKQIRELMKVDGLTNDEVKSHLQKYRLHTRSSTSPAAEATSNDGGATQQRMVLVGGLWAQPLPQYATTATPPHQPLLPSNGHHTQLSTKKACDGGKSPATSTSSHTITTH